jgi:hypothetical protein
MLFHLEYWKGRGEERGKRRIIEELKNLNVGIQNVNN